MGARHVYGAHGPQGVMRHLIQGALVLLLFLLAIKLWQLAFLDQLALTRGPSRHTFLEQQSDPLTLSNLAARQYLNQNDSAGARSLYGQALIHQSLHLPAWIGLAELEADLGHRDVALRLADYIDQAAPETNRWRWSRTMLAHNLGQDKLLRKNLSWIVANDPRHRSDALYLAVSHWTDPEEVLDQLGLDNAPSLLSHYMDRKEVAASKQIWQRLPDLQRGDEKLVLRYVNFLIAGKDIPAAASAWQSLFKDHDDLLSNSDFSHAFRQSGFDWRLSRAKGVTLNTRPQEARLDVTFAGTDNVILRLQQLVPLQPEKPYRLSGELMARQLTTNERPYWRISGYGCPGLDVRTDIVGENQDWGPFALTFTVPLECQAVWVGLHRNKSHFFDNKIAGTVAVRNLRLQESSEQLVGD